MEFSLKEIDLTGLKDRWAQIDESLEQLRQDTLSLFELAIEVFQRTREQSPNLRVKAERQWKAPVFTATEIKTRVGLLQKERKVLNSWRVRRCSRVEKKLDAITRAKTTLFEKVLVCNFQQVHGTTIYGSSKDDEALREKYKAIETSYQKITQTHLPVVLRKLNAAKKVVACTSEQMKSDRKISRLSRSFSDHALWDAQVSPADLERATHDLEAFATLYRRRSADGLK